MSSTGESAAVICALMDAQITDKEFNEGIARNKILHDCKTKGFPDLERRGLIRKPAKKEVKVITLSNEDFATMGAAAVNAGKTSIAAFCRQHGRNNADLRYYCDKFGIDLVRKIKRENKHDHGKIYRAARRLINQQGYRLSNAAKKLKVSPTFIITVLRENKCTYNAKTVKVEKVKK